VPFIAVKKQGGAVGNKQFENVAAPDEAVMLKVPVDARLLFERRMLPALVGQVREVVGKATKEAGVPDKPALLGRVLSPRERQEMRSGAHSRRATDGVLACDDAWRLYGLPGPPQAPQQQGQKGLLSFFSKGGKAAAPAGAPAASAAEQATSTLDASDPMGTPRKGLSADELEEAVTQCAAEVERLRRERRQIGLAAGQEKGEADILCNLAASLANAMRLLEAAQRKQARCGATTPQSAAARA
jgi:hypothetical protein